VTPGRGRVPRPESLLLALNDEHTLTGKHEKALLPVLAVI